MVDKKIAIKFTLFFSGHFMSSSRGFSFFGGVGGGGGGGGRE